MRYIVILFCILFFQLAHAQSRKAKHRISNAKGALFASLGYNRSVYTKTKAHFEGTGYIFDLRSAKAHDMQSPLGSGDYLNFKCQFNLKAGYYYKKVWAVSVNLDHMKYVFSNYNNVLLTGSVTMNANNVTFGDGQSFAIGYHTNVPVSTYEGDFSYQTTKGMNFIHTDLNRTIKLLGGIKRNSAVLTSNIGVGAGLIVTSVDFNYAGRKTVDMVSVSGYGFAASTGLRLEFLRRAYVYSTFSVGALHQVHVKSRTDELLAYSSQFFGFSQVEMGLGILLYKRSKNKCDDCPVW
jgi:hypothetical protein